MAKNVRRPRVPKVMRPTLTPVEVVKLLDACDERFVAVVAFCQLHGWRVSETLGLAWQDLDVEAGTVHPRRGSTYADAEGMVLGPTKTRWTGGLAAARPERGAAPHPPARVAGARSGPCGWEGAGGVRGRVLRSRRRRPVRHSDVYSGVHAGSHTGAHTVMIHPDWYRFVLFRPGDPQSGLLSVLVGSDLS